MILNPYRVKWHYVERPNDINITIRYASNIRNAVAMIRDTEQRFTKNEIVVIEAKDLTEHNMYRWG